MYCPRSPSGPSVRQGRTGLAEPYYDGGSKCFMCFLNLSLLHIVKMGLLENSGGVGKIGTTSAYDDYNTMLLDTAAYVPEVLFENLRVKIMCSLRWIY